MDEQRAERVTMLTDFFLAAVAAGLAVPLLRAPAQSGLSEIRSWGLVFAFTAAAALVGGVFHGLRHSLPERPSRLFWRLTLLLSAAASFFLVAAVARGTASTALGEALMLVGGAKLALVSLLLARTDSFSVIAYDSGASLLLVGAVTLGDMVWGTAGRGGVWILAGVVISVTGAVAQQRGLRLGRYLDHNDLFHFVQAAACYLFFQGAGPA